MRKLILKVVTLILVSTSAVLICSCQKNNETESDIKGGSDALTVYDVNTSSLIVTNGDKRAEFSGDEWNELISAFKNAKETDVSENEVDFDIKIDFNNGNIGYISSKYDLFKMEDVYYMLEEDAYNKLKGGIE